MMWTLIVLCCVILLVSVEKMSFMPLKVSMAWVAIWGLCGYFATTFLAGLSRQEAYTVLNTANISTFEFIELLIMLSFIFSKGMINKMLGLYPGLMTIAPVCVISYLSIGLFPGMNFLLTGAITGGAICLALAGLTLLFRYLAVGSNTFYKTVLAAAIINIIIYGLL